MGPASRLVAGDRPHLPPLALLPTREHPQARALALATPLPTRLEEEASSDRALPRPPREASILVARPPPHLPPAASIFQAVRVVQVVFLATPRIRQVDCLVKARPHPLRDVDSHNHRRTTSLA